MDELIYWEKKVTELNLAVRKVRGQFMRYADATGINYQKLLILMVLLEEGQAIQKDISLGCGMAKQVVNKYVQELLSENYISMERDKNDARQQVMKLTQTGEQFAEENLYDLFHLHKEVCTRFGEENLLLMTKLMQEYGRITEEEINKTRL